MTRFLTLLAAISLTGKAVACDEPDISNVDIPAGASATEQEVLAAQRTVAEIVEAIEAYAACVDGLSGAEQRNHLRSRDQAVDAAHRLATRMNREIRNFNRAEQLASR